MIHDDTHIKLLDLYIPEIGTCCSRHEAMASRRFQSRTGCMRGATGSDSGVKDRNSVFVCLRQNRGFMLTESTVEVWWVWRWWQIGVAKHLVIFVIRSQLARWIFYRKARGSWHINGHLQVPLLGSFKMCQVSSRWFFCMYYVYLCWYFLDHDPHSTSIPSLGLAPRKPRCGAIFLFETVDVLEKKVRQQHPQLGNGPLIWRIFPFSGHFR